MNPNARYFRSPKDTKEIIDSWKREQENLRSNGRGGLGQIPVNSRQSREERILADKVQRKKNSRRRKIPKNAQVLGEMASLEPSIGEGDSGLPSPGLGPTGDGVSPVVEEL